FLPDNDHRCCRRKCHHCCSSCDRSRAVAGLHRIASGSRFLSCIRSAVLAAVIRAVSAVCASCCSAVVRNDCSCALVRASACVLIRILRLCRIICSLVRRLWFGCCVFHDQRALCCRKLLSRLVHHILVILRKTIVRQYIQGISKCRSKCLHTVLCVCGYIN